jgi:hypothetical protein
MTEIIWGPLRLHNGGECPVPGDTMVQVWLRGGKFLPEESVITDWKWDVHGESAHDIIGFRDGEYYLERMK